MKTQQLVKQSKQDAKKLVSQNFGKFGLLILITYLVLMLPIILTEFYDTIQFFIAFLSGTRSLLSHAYLTVAMPILIFMISPIVFGLYKCFNDANKTGDFEFKDLFYYFRTLHSYIRCVKFEIYMFIKLIPFIFLSLVGFALIVYSLFSGGYVYDNFLGLIMLVCGLLLILFSIIMICLKSFVYKSGYLTMIENEEIGCSGTIKQAIELFNGYNKEIIYFLLSFILWYFLSFITSGIIMFFLAPYIEISFIKLINNIKIDKANAIINNNDNIDVDYSNDNINTENSFPNIDINPSTADITDINKTLEN